MNPLMLYFLLNKDSLPVGIDDDDDSMLPWFITGGVIIGIAANVLMKIYWF